MLKQLRQHVLTYTQPAHPTPLCEKAIQVVKVLSRHGALMVKAAQAGVADTLGRIVMEGKDEVVAVWVRCIQAGDGAVDGKCPSCRRCCVVRARMLMRQLAEPTVVHILKERMAALTPETVSHSLRLGSLC